jgi:hypothetical protein
MTAKRLLLLLAGFLLPAAPHALTITKTSAPEIYVDPGNSIVCNYVSFAIYNETPADVNDVWAGISNFSSSNVGLAPLEPGLTHLGPIPSGVTRTAYFYLQATQTASVQTATVTLYSAKPPATTLTSQTVSWNQVEATGQNASNKVNAVFSGPNPPVLGGYASLSVTGDTGTIGNRNEVDFSPATYTNWDSGRFQLVGVDLQWGSGLSGSDFLAITGTTSADQGAYTVIFHFRLMAPTSVQAKVSTIAFCASGANIAHTTTGAYLTADFAPTVSLNSYLTLSKTATVNSIIWPNPVTYSLAVHNSGVLPATLDSLVDQLPAGGPYTVVPGSSAWDGVPVPDPSLSGSQLTWSGQYNVPADTTLALTFQLVLAPAAGIYVNTGWGTVGSLQIDGTLDATDNSPTAWSVSQTMPTGTPTSTITPTFSVSPTPSPSFTDVPPGSTLTNTPTATPSATATPTVSATGTASLTWTRSPTRTITLTRTFSPTATTTPTRSPSPAGTLTITQSSTPSPSRTPSATRTPTPTPSGTGTVTASPSLSATGTVTGTPSITLTATESPTFSPSQTFSASPTESPTFSPSPSWTASPTATLTATETPSATETSSFTSTPTATETATPTPTFSVTKTITPTWTDSPTGTVTATVTPTSTPVSNPSLSKPYPNPFRPLKGQLLRMDLSVAVPGTVKVKAYNLAGEFVRLLLETTAPNGILTVYWDGNNNQGDAVASGTYVILAETPSGPVHALVAVIK